MTFRSLLLLAAILVLVTITANLIDGDFQVFHQASRLLLARQNPYSVIAYVGSKGFIYPPIALWITLIPSLLPLGFAQVAWTVICQMLWVVSIFLWCRMIWKKEVTSPEFVNLLAITLIAPCWWSFWLHQLIMVAFFGGTLAVWLTWGRKSAFWTGIWAGLSLLKPHLFLPMILWLDYASPNRRLFRLGIFATLIGSASPFLVGYRPFSDFRDMAAVVGKHSASLYSRDEQGLPARLVALSMAPEAKTTLYAFNVNRRSNFYVPDRLIQGMNRAKMVIFIVFLTGWGIALRSWANDDLAWSAALSLALGLFFSVYSHLYDGLLLIPLLLFAVRRSISPQSLSQFMGMAFCINVFLAVWLMLDRTLKEVHWDRTGWTSLLYLAAILALYGRSHWTENIARRS